MNGDGSEDWDLAALIVAIGTADFPTQLSETLNQLCHIDHVGLFAFDDRLIPVFVSGHSATRPGVTDEAHAQYVAGRYFRHDPNLHVVKSKRNENEGVLMTRLRMEDITDAGYRTEVYERYDLAERVSLLDLRYGRWYTINLYRDTPVGVFSDADIALLHKHCDVLSAIVYKHFSLDLPSAWVGDKRPSVARLEERIKALIAGDGPKLSAREVEVCARAVIGISGEGIGLDLGVKPSTVATLRKRAYTKLGISSVHELFAMCLNIDDN